MKYRTTLLAASTFLTFSGFAMADCNDGSCSKEKCATTCVADNGTATNFVVDGMTCGKCSTKIADALKDTEGVTVKKVCHKSGHAVVNINQDKTTKAAVAKVIEDTGFTVTGEQVSMNVAGMTCGGCSKKIKSKLASLEGVSVKKVCHKSGHVVVTIDSDKTDESKVEAAITKAGFKVAEPTASKS